MASGAKSLQTQEIFHRLVKDNTTQDDPVKAVSDMRLAIKNTNVVLNMAISPGIILIPSNMIILKERVAGYNNVLTLATKDMKFGVNENVNKAPAAEPVSPTTTTTPVPVSPTPLPKTDETAYLLEGAITLGYVVARYLI